MSTGKSPRLREMKVLSFHSVKGAVGKTTLCLSAFVKLARRLQPESSGDQERPIWVVDLDIGGRPMFYGPRHSVPCEATTLDVLSWTQRPGEHGMRREQTPLLVSQEGTAPESKQGYPGDWLWVEPSTAVGQALVDESARVRRTGRFLGMTARAAFRDFRDASHIDYLRLCRRVLELVASGDQQSVWLLLDCSPGIGRANEAVMDAIAGFAAEEVVSERNLSVYWQPVVVTTPEVATQAIVEEVLEPALRGSMSSAVHCPQVLNMVRPDDPDQVKPDTLLGKVLQKTETPPPIDHLLGRTMVKSGDRSTRTGVSTAPAPSLPETRIETASQQQWIVPWVDEVRRAFQIADDRLFLPTLQWEPRAREFLAGDLLAEALGHSVPEHTSRSSPHGNRSASVRIPLMERVNPSLTVPVAVPAKPEAHGGEDDLEGFLALVELEGDTVEGPAVAPRIREAVERLRRARHKVDPIQIGNLAVTAESCKLYDEAYALFSHIREDIQSDFAVARQYISFLLDTKYRPPEPDVATGSSDPVEIAGKLLAHFSNQRESMTAEHRAHFNALVAQLPQEKRPIDFDTTKESLAAVEAFEKHPNRESLLKVMALLHYSTESTTKELERIAEAIVKLPLEHWTLEGIRMVADEFAAGDSEAEERAIHLYKRLEGSELWRSDTKHNLAVLLRHREPERATQLWFEGYQENRRDTGLARAFARHLMSQNRHDLAEKVLHGEAIEKEELVKRKG